LKWRAQRGRITHRIEAKEEHLMAITMTMRWPGVTKEQYLAALKEID